MHIVKKAQKTKTKTRKCGNWDALQLEATQHRASPYPL